MEIRLHARKRVRRGISAATSRAMLRAFLERLCGPPPHPGPRWAVVPGSFRPAPASSRDVPPGEPCEHGITLGGGYWCSTCGAHAYTLDPMPAGSASGWHTPEVRQRNAETERAAIVAWLRRYARNGRPRPAVNDLATMIELRSHHSRLWDDDDG